MMSGLYETKLLTKKIMLFPTQKLGLGGTGALKPLMKYRSTITSRPSSEELLHCYTDISLNLPRFPMQKTNSRCLYTG